MYVVNMLNTTFIIKYKVPHIQLVVWSILADTYSLLCNTFIVLTLNNKLGIDVKFAP